MEVDATSSSSRRKSMPLKVKLTVGAKGDIKVNGDKKDVDLDANSDAESENSDIPELPEGTVVVQPEPVEEEKIEFTGPEFKSTKKTGAGVSTNLDNLFCTACGRQINPWKSGMVKKHKVLRVVTCRKCYVFVGSGKITQDEDGMDEQCRWCGEGGRLTVCDKCPRAFCKSCIMRNFGRAAFTTVTESENWDCYICNPEPLEELRKHTRHVFAAIKAVNGKKSKSSEPPATKDDDTKPPPSRPSVKAPKKDTSANGKQDVSNDINEESDGNEKTKKQSKTTVEKALGKKNKNKTKDIKEEEDSESETKKVSKSKKPSKSQKAEDSEEEEEDDEAEEKKAKSAIKKKQAENGFSGEVKVEETAKDLDSSEEDEILDRDIDSLLDESESGLGLKTNDDEDDSDDEKEEEVSSKRRSSKKKRKADKVDKKEKKGNRKKRDDSSEMSDDDIQDDDEDDKEDTTVEAPKPKKRGRPKKIKKAKSDDEAADDVDDEENGDDQEASGSESEAGAPKKRKGRKPSTDQKKGKKIKKEADEDDLDLEAEDGKRKRTRGKVVKTEGVESDSDIEVKPKRKRKKKKDSDDESFSGEKSSGEEEEEDEEGGDSVVDSDEVGGGDDDVSDEPGAGKKKGRGKGKKGKGKGKEKGRKRKRIKKMKGSSSDEEAVEPAEEGEDPSSRKKIRKIKSDKKLGDTTKAAARAEEERRQRVAEKQEKFNGVEQKDMGTGQAPMTTKLVLEQEEDTKEPVIQVNSKLVRKLKPHQVEAVQFMWDCMFESVERSKKEEPSAGCILAHCMGLGKTLSVVAFIHTMMTHKELTGIKTCLVVSPLNTVLNWMNEFDIWLDEEDKLEVWEMASVKQNLQRSQVLDEWFKNGGIMIIGYEMLRNLSQGSRVRNKKQKTIFHKTLIDPGPDIVVCDEGHVMKNAASALSKAMNQIRTRRRVVLTGTPLQNNLIEYHCMVDFVKPNLLGTKKEFANRFVNPITNGQHSDSTPRDVRVMKNRAHILHELLAGCVQRRDYSALTKFLPPKQEYVISVRLSDMQISLYEEYLKRNGQVEGQITTRGAQLFKDYQNLMKIWTHPWVLKLAEIRDENKMKYDDEDSFIDDECSDEERSFGSDDCSSDESEPPAKAVSEEDSAGEGTSSGRRSRRLRNKSSDKDEIVKDWKTKSRGGEGDDWPVDLPPIPQAVSEEWWAEYVKEEDQNKMEHSGKLVLLFDILRMCEEIGDKVLIFSQSLLSLDIIEYFLEHVDSKFTAETQDKPDEELKEEFGKRWTKGEDYFRLDGSTSAQMRQHWAAIFNDSENLRARLFLISTRAGGLGINLVGANRVIIFDASWNPSHDVQSIFRVYRFGQVKPCYIYRFMAQGTMEEKIYDRQVTKLSLSQRVVDEHQVERHFTAADLAELYAFKPDRLSDADEKKETLMLPKDVLLAEIMSGDQRSWFVTMHEHDSLLENLVEQELTEEEKKAAWEEYENEKKGLRMNVSPMGHGGFGLGNYLSQEFLLQTARNLREQNPDMPQEVLQMHLQRIIMMQIRQRQEEQRRLELLQRQQFMQMQQHYAQLQQQYLQQMGQEGGGMFPPSLMHLAPGQRFSPSLYAHMAMPGLSAFHGGVAAAALNSGSGSGSSREEAGNPSGGSSGSSSKAGTSKEASTSSPSSSPEVTEKDKSKD